MKFAKYSLIPAILGIFGLIAFWVVFSLVPHKGIEKVWGTDPVLIASYLFAIGIGLIVYGLMDLKRLHVVQGTPTAKIRSMAIGRIEIKGTIQESEKTIKVPLTGLDCVYYRIVISKKVYSDQGYYWEPVKTKEESTPFYVEDETGKVLILPEKLELDVKPFQTILIEKEPPGDIKELLKEYDINYKDLLGRNKEFKIEEYTLRIGDHVYLLGYAGILAKPVENQSMAVQFKQGEPFLISDKQEYQLRGQYHWWIAKVWAGSVGIIISAILMVPLTGLLEWKYVFIVAIGAFVALTLISAIIGIKLRLRQFEKRGQ